jgi:CHASE3 domain sensor protein
MCELPESLGIWKMPVEQWLPPVLSVAGVLFGGGGLAALYGVYVNRKLGIKTNQNEANRDLNTTWDSIVENLQAQINSQTENFRNELSRVNEELKEMKKRQGELEEAVNAKERMILRAIAHIIILEALIVALGGTKPPRPEGLE